MFFSLFIYLSTYLCIHLSILIFSYEPVFLFIYLSIFLPVYPSLSLFQVTMQVSERRSYIVPMPYIILETRLKNYSFSYAFDFGSMAFVMASPSLAPSWLSLSLPFSGGVWLATCVTFIVLPAVLKLVSGLVTGFVSYFFVIL